MSRDALVNPADGVACQDAAMAHHPLIRIIVSVCDDDPERLGLDVSVGPEALDVEPIQIALVLSDLAARLPEIMGGIYLAERAAMN